MLRTATLFFRTLALCFSTLASTAEAIIVESPTLKTILKYIPKQIDGEKPKKVLILFDIDNNIAWNYLGDAHFSYEFKKGKKLEKAIQL